MTDEFCARPGCGAPKAWHTSKSTIGALSEWDTFDSVHSYAIPSKRGCCLGYLCTCPGFLALKPPEPERKAYVVMLGDADAKGAVNVLEVGQRGINGASRWAEVIPIDEYLAAHPQPLAFPANTKCAVRGCDYYTATVLCTHCAASLAKFTKQQLMDGPTSAHAALCVCGGTADDHDPVTGRCHHVVRHMWKPDAGLGARFVEEQHCFCQKFEAAR